MCLRTKIGVTLPTHIKVALKCDIYGILYFIDLDCVNRKIYTIKWPTDIMKGKLIINSITQILGDSMNVYWSMQEWELQKPCFMLLFHKRPFSVSHQCYVVRNIKTFSFEIGGLIMDLKGLYNKSPHNSCGGFIIGSCLQVPQFLRKPEFSWPFDLWWPWFLM